MTELGGLPVDIAGAWQRLQAVTQMTFEARSRAATKTGWSGSGVGTVAVEIPDAGAMLFHERGTWTPDEGRPSNFSNVFRWTLDGDRIRLEHLRFGPQQPVYLFDLKLSDGALVSSTPHVCREDCYSARMEFGDQTIHFDWTVSGPNKAETIRYVYSS